jgi:hypothetical protein
VQIATPVCCLRTATSVYWVSIRFFCPPACGSLTGIERGLIGCAAVIPLKPGFMGLINPAVIDIFRWIANRLAMSIGPFVGRKRRKDSKKMKYKVHRFDIRMTTDQSRPEQFLNSLEGEVVAIFPNVTIAFMWVHKVDFLFIIEKLG